MAKIECCHDCRPPKRRIGCHATCPEYIYERAELDKQNAEKARRRELQDGLYQQKEKAIDIAIKRERKKFRKR